MSQRRMFSPDIVSSEEFLSMPVSSRELYSQLGMNADDDGFIQPKKIMRYIGASDDDLKVLLLKRFLLSFDGGVVVIKHWLIHNMIRHDRYKPTRFQDEKKTLFIKDNKAYTEKDNSWQPNGNQMAPQVRLGKVRLDKIETSIDFLKKIPKEVLEEFVLKFICDTDNITTKANSLFDYCESKGKKYKNYKALLSNALRKDFGERPAKSKIPIFDTSGNTAKIIGHK